MRGRVATASLALVGVLAIAATAQRLPPTAVPEHYDIHLAPDFATDTFAGRVSIDVRLPAPATAVTLHAAEIEFHEATITAAGTTQVARVSLDPAAETATLAVAQAIGPGPATIAIRYTGRLNDQLRGFYLSRANGRKYAITQLEATDARRAFPSFDEPALKATFALSATVDAGDTAISNGRLLSDTPGPGAGRHTLRFATTRRMSTYLVALIVGDWECVSGAADGIPLRVCGTPDRKAELSFALEATGIALRYFNRYFAIPYPFEKLDIVAVPDFAAGAMENTGAIVFREEFLLVGRETGSAELQKVVAQYVAHEIAHQWFGNLVTMQWWDDIWLNEGFATWMERRPMAEWKPEWNVAVDEVRDTQRAMALDALGATRPIRTRVEAPEEINEVFDAIAYQKTAAVVRMVEGFVGETAYRRGINAYLKKFAYGNATGEGFWTTLAAATKRPVDRIFATYVTQRGMPLVDVRARCTGGRTELTLSQKPMAAGVAPDATWEIPVCYRRGRDGRVEPAACSLLSARSASVTLDGCSTWVFANAGGRGYYRTSYGADGLQSLGSAVRAGRLTPAEETSLIEDVWALVRLNEESIASYFSLAGNLMARQPGPAVSSVLSRIAFTADYLVDADLQPAFERWTRQTLGPVAERLGWTPRPGEPDETRRLRADVLFTLGYAGRDPEVLTEARRRVDRHLDGTLTLDPSLTRTAVSLAAIGGDAALYDRYLARMTAASNQDQVALYRSALTYFRDPALTKRTLAYATSPDIRSQDAPTVINQLMDRPWAAPAAWEHVKQHWTTLEQSLGMFQGLPALVASPNGFCDPASRADVAGFFERHPVRGAERTLRQTLDTIDACIATQSAQSRPLAEFLARAVVGGDVKTF